METKLKNTALQLPMPALAFCTIEQKAKVNAGKSHKKITLLRAAAVAVLIICLSVSAFAYGKVRYGLWSGLHSKGYGDVILLNWKYDYHFPEEFFNLKFSSMSTYYGAPEGATHLGALLMPTYTLHSVDYGDYSGTVMENGTTQWSGKQIHISFGTTEIDTWKYHFSVGEDGFCSYEDVIPDSQRKIEYDGYTLYAYSIGDSHCVRWEDPTKELVLSISTKGFETQDEAVRIAEVLIDMNR